MSEVNDRRGSARHDTAVFVTEKFETPEAVCDLRRGSIFAYEKAPQRRPRVNQEERSVSLQLVHSTAHRKQLSNGDHLSRLGSGRRDTYLATNLRTTQIRIPSSRRVVASSKTIGVLAIGTKEKLGWTFFRFE